MLFHGSSARTGWAKDLAGYWRELLFWMLLLPAFGALGSIRLFGARENVPSRARLK